MTTPTRRRDVRVVGPLSTVPTGASRVTHMVLDALEASGEARIVRVDTGDGGDGSVRADLVGRLRRMLGGLVGLATARHRSGSVYIGGAGGEVLWYQAIVVLLARVAGLRTVFHHHSYWYLTATRWPMRAITVLGGRSLTHVVLCEGMGDMLRQRYRTAVDVVVCSNAGLLGEAVGSVGGRQPVLTLGHLSNLSMEKGLGEVLATLRLLRSRGHDARLVLAGPSTTPEVERVIESAALELGDALTVLGRIAPDTVDDFYRRIDAFMFPSLYAQEAEPLVVLDAARNGVPTIAFAVGCLPGMVPPDHVVPTHADFAQTATAILTADAWPGPSADVARAFAARREAARKAHALVVSRLLTQR